MTSTTLRKWNAELNRTALADAGGKGAQLGELARAGVPVPPGFLTTTEAYNTFVETNHLQTQIRDMAARVDDAASAEAASEQIRALFAQAAIPGERADEIRQAYQRLAQPDGEAVAVRSSATAEDLPTASFAGQHDTPLNVQSELALLDAVKHCWASLWTARAMMYRRRQDIDPGSVSLAVVVQQLVPADCSGILFTANPLDGDRDHIVINAAWGLGEAVVGGHVTPDTVVVDKSKHSIVSRETATKATMTARTVTGTPQQPVPLAQQRQPVLTDASATELARYGARIEAHFGYPVDIEWAIRAGEITILQARPITKLPPAPRRDVRWEPICPGTVWMRRQVVEHRPEPLSPLFDELYLSVGLDHSMNTIVDYMGDLAGIQIDMWDFIQPPFAATVKAMPTASPASTTSGGSCRKSCICICLSCRR